MTQLIRDYLVRQECIEIDTPKLLAEATEGGAEVFRLDYFNTTATLAQSPQFYKQIMVGAFERVFEIGHSYRAEPSATTRHLTELTMLDVEIGFVEDHSEVLDFVAAMTQDVRKRRTNTMLTNCVVSMLPNSSCRLMVWCRALRLLKSTICIPRQQKPTRQAKKT